MLCTVKVPLKGEVGGRAINSHGNYIVDQGKSWNCVFEFLWEPCKNTCLDRWEGKMLQFYNKIVSYLNLHVCVSGL